MEKILFILIMAFSITTFMFSDVHVNGYTKADGTQVEEHYRSSPNDTVSDNYSTYGNINPYTGEEGTKRVYDDYDDSGEAIYTDTVINDKQGLPSYLHIIFIFLCTYIVIVIINLIMTKLHDWFSEDFYYMSRQTMFVLLCFTAITYWIIISQY